MKKCNPLSLVFSAFLVSSSPFLSGINRLEKKTKTATLTLQRCLEDFANPTPVLFHVKLSFDITTFSSAEGSYLVSGLKCFLAFFSIHLISHL